MARRFAVLVLVLFVIGASPADAASPWATLADPIFVHADTGALPEGAVMALAIDSAGFVWVGTQGGLARFDGYRYRSYLPNPSDPGALPDGYIRALAAADDGGLWIGSSSDGLVRFDAASERFHTWHPARGGGSGPRSAAVNAIVVAPDGTLWIGGDGGLDRFDPHTGRFTALPLASARGEPIVWSLRLDHAGTLWAGTQRGLFFIPRDATRARPFRLHPTAGLATPVVYSVYEDAAQHVWAGSVNAVYAIDRVRHAVREYDATGNAASLAPGQQWSIIEMHPGRIWIGTDSAISIIDTAAGSVRRVEADPENPGGLTGGRVVQFLRDRSGTVWLANHVGGLLLFNPRSHGLYELSSTRPEIGFENEGAVALAAVPGGAVWVGGLIGHLARFDPHTHAVRRPAIPNHAAVQTLLPRPDGSLWIGTTDGLCRLRAGASAADCPAGPHALAAWSIYSLIAVGSRLWIGGNGGYAAADTSTGTLLHPGAAPGTLANAQVRVLFRDHRDRLWIGTENGLARRDPDGRIVPFLFDAHDPNSIGPGGMTSIIEDRRGRIWAGTNGGPLNVIEDLPGGRTRITRLGTGAGLPHENVDGLAQDARGRIWASTDKGMAVIDPVTLRARGLGPADGVSQGEYWAGSATRSSDGTMFFGGLHGVTVVAPDAASPWTYAPPVVATALTIGRRNVPAWQVDRPGASIELPADARDVSLDFAALDYTAPQALRYAYRLDGYDRDWIEADAQHRAATYTHLPPGDYTLEVRGTNRLGAWSAAVLRVGVRVLPAWYETSWFRFLAVALLLLAGYGAHLVRTTVLLRRQRELEALVNERTLELSQANAKLEDLSLSDPLTGLRNRRFLAQHLDADIAMTVRRYQDWNADRTAEPPADADLLFFLVDLDNFKLINDRYGHNAGDAVLVEMRERLREVFRESDFVVRWGGDEFLAVARGGHRRDAPGIAERLRLAVGTQPFTVGTGRSLSGTASIGFAAFPFVVSQPAHVNWFDVVGLADHALYLAKQAGRDTWRGLAATEATNPTELEGRLAGTPERVVRAGNLEIVSPATLADLER